MGCDYYEFVTLEVAKEGSSSTSEYCRNGCYDGAGDDYERYTQESTVIYRNGDWLIKNKHARKAYMAFIDEEMEIDTSDILTITKHFKYEERM